MMFKRLLVAAACAAAVTIRAAEPAAPTEPTQPAAAASNESPLEKEMQPIMEKVAQKVHSGAKTEAELADELKAIDGVLAAHRGEKTEDVAQVALVRAAIYLEVFSNFTKAQDLLRAIATDYPGTKAAAEAGEVVPRLEAQKKAQAIQDSLQPGVAFPDFAEKDLNGQPLSVGKYKGKVVLVDFWATWCGPCVGELPNVIAAYDKYHPKGFEIVGLSLDQDEGRLKSFIADRKIAWAQHFDGKGWESPLAEKYGVNSIPATYLLDRDGKIVAKNLRGEELDAELAKLLAK